jgi:ABC-type dipeptide/oligopeptide/nickel transport system ATPase subunit
MLLQIENLKTHYSAKTGPVKAVDGVSLNIGEGEVFGIAGESGCGKSTLIRTIMRLVPESAHVSADRLSLNGTELLPLSDKQYRDAILWKKISMVPQSAMNSLNPVYRVGDQIAEAIQTHTDLDRKAAMERVKELFQAVGLEAGLVRNYPHEFSGGMRQRSLIAMALALSPSLIIMDEPTTGLDVLVQERILRSLAEIRARWGSGTPSPAFGPWVGSSSPSPAPHPASQQTPPAACSRRAAPLPFPSASRSGRLIWRSSPTISSTVSGPITWRSSADWQETRRHGNPRSRTPEEALHVPSRLSREIIGREEGERDQSGRRRDL